MRKIFLICVPILLLANEFKSPLADEMSWLNDETFVISASRVKENIKKSSASISVIDEETINKMGANTLLDIFRIIPGLGVSQSNIYVDKITVRGIETWFSEKVLILLDGHSLNSDLLNGGALGTFTNFPLEQIKRVEIIKGPASALYGENAFTALINIITKDAKEIGGAHVSVKTGSYNTNTANLLFGHLYNNFDLSANINYRDTQGYKAYIARDAVGNSGYTDPTSKRISTNLHLKHKNGFSLKANYNKAEDGPRYGIVHALNDEDNSQRETYFVELDYKYRFDNSFTLDSKIYHDSFEAENFWEINPEGSPTAAYTNGLIAFSGYKSTKSGCEALVTVKGEDATLVTGLSYEIQKLRNPVYKANYNPLTNALVGSFQDFSAPDTNFVSEEDRKFWALYSELLYDPRDDLRLTAGVRYDNYSDFGEVVNPRLGAAWQANEHNNIKVMYGQAFRAPTFAELYNKNNPTLVGNSNLKPERVKTLELNIQNTDIPTLTASLTFFKSTIDNIITTANKTYINQGKTTSTGIEAELKKELNRGSYILANYTFQEPKNRLTSEDLENISQHEAYLALNYRINKHFNLYTDAKYAGDQTRSSTSSREKVDESITCNATLLVKKLLAKELSMKFSIYNLFDEKSYDSNNPYDYPLAGRSYMAELSYKF